MGLLKMGREGFASKGLHMVSAVHLLMTWFGWATLSLQRGCTWLVQFIEQAKPVTETKKKASKGLHMVSAVHQVARNRIGRIPLGFKGAAHG